MKYISKKLLHIALLIMLVFLTFLHSSSAYADTLMLKKGMSGSYVSQLQQDLKKTGFYNYKLTGYFGEITEASVKEFQKKYKINPDGVVGQTTRAKIDSLLKASNAPGSAGSAGSNITLQNGTKGDTVLQLQNSLKKLGFFTGSPTGYFGNVTEASVKSFQRQYGLLADGKAGPSTLPKISLLLKKRSTTKIVIDPGHGGIDPGTARGNAVEKEITLSISKNLTSFLGQKGYSVSLTRDSDVSLYKLSNISGSTQLRDLNARTNIINKSGIKLFVSIHVNSYPDSPSTSGSIVYYNGKLHQSKILAENIQKVLNGIVSGGKKRMTHSPQKADFYVIRNSNVLGVLVETAFITNTQDRQLLMTNSFRNKVALAIVQGIENYLN